MIIRYKDFLGGFQAKNLLEIITHNKKGTLVDIGSIHISIY